MIRSHGVAFTVFMACITTALSAQCVRFQQPTDTIRLSAQTIIGAAATIEAVVWLDGPASAGVLFDEWTDNAEDKRLLTGPNQLQGYGLLSQGVVEYDGQVVTDRWHHVAFVYDGSMQRMFLDGQLVANHPGTGSFSNASGLGHLGATPQPGLSSFRGFLESFRISSVARYTGSGFVPPLRDMSADASTLVLYNFDDAAGSSSVVDSSGNGNHGALGIGVVGATSPALGHRVMTCQRTAGGVLNQQIVDAANGVITVAAGAAIQGSVQLLTLNDMHPGAVAPLAGTANWGLRTAQFWTIDPWIPVGQHVHAATVQVVAPTQPGTYFLIFGFSGMYGADQVMSSTHPAGSAIWFDGNDVGFDWTAQQFETAMANGGAVPVSLRMPDGSLETRFEAFTAVRVDVTASASVAVIGAGCPGSNGTPALQATPPVMGNTSVLALTNLAIGQFAIIAWGGSSTNWNGAPLPLDLGIIGMPNCMLRVSPEAPVGGINFGGIMLMGLAIPSGANWLGTQFFAQGLAFDPGVNAFGATLSNALAMTIGY